MASKKKTVKKVPPRKGAGAKAPKNKPFRLEVGKTYLSEKGVKVVMEDFIDNDPDDLRFHTKEGYVFKLDGTPWMHGYATENVCGNLVREVKPPVKAGAKGKKVPVASLPGLRPKKKSR